MVSPAVSPPPRPGFLTKDLPDPVPPPTPLTCSTPSTPFLHPLHPFARLPLIPSPFLIPTSPLGGDFGSEAVPALGTPPPHPFFLAWMSPPAGARQRAPSPGRHQSAAGAPLPRTPPSPPALAAGRRRLLAGVAAAAAVVVLTAATVGGALFAHRGGAAPRPWTWWPLSLTARPAATAAGAACDTRAGYCGATVRECRDAPAATPPHPAARNGRPLLVVAAGGSRAASTWVYNVARILLRVRDPNTVAGWYEDLAAMVGAYAQLVPGNDTYGEVGAASRLEALRSLDTSVLIKVHLVQEWATLLGGEHRPPKAGGGRWGAPWGRADEPPDVPMVELSEAADVVLTSHRDVREVVRSLRHMGWGTRVNPAAFSHPDFCRRPYDARWAPAPLGAAGYADADAWVAMARAHLLCRERLLASAGDKLVLDVPAEALAGASAATQARLVQAVAAAFDWPYTDAELAGVVTEVARLRVPPCAAPAGGGGGGGVHLVLNPTTHIHRGHIRLAATNVEAVDAAGVAAIEADPVCRAWLVRHGYMEKGEGGGVAAGVHDGRGHDGGEGGGGGG